jgi:hypothetical protein
MENKEQIKLQIMQVLLVVILLLYIPLRNLGAPVFIFWPIFFSIIITSLIIVLKCNKTYKIISILVLELCLSLIFIVSLPNISQMNRDVYFESEYASTIIKNGAWNPKLGSGFAENYYGYNPALHFVLAFSSITTGLTTYALSKYFFFIILRLALVISVYLLLSEFFKAKRKENEKIIFLAMFIFIASTGMAFIEVSRRLIAGIFMVLALWALLRAKTETEKKKRMVWNGLFYLFSIIVVIGNHSIAYLFLILLIAIWIFGIIAKLRIFRKWNEKNEEIGNYPDVMPELMYFLVIFYLWQAFVSMTLLDNDLNYISNIMQILSDGYGVKLIFNVKGANTATFIYHAYETVIMYSYHLLFISLCILGYLFFVAKLTSKKADIERKIDNKFILLLLGSISMIMYMVSFALMRTQLDSAAYTFLWFFCAILSIFIAYFINGFIGQKIPKALYYGIIVVISLLVYTGYVFTGIYTPRITNRALNEGVVIGYDIRSQSDEIYYSASWLDKNSEERKIIGDVNVFEVYSGMFDFDVSSDDYKLKAMYNGTLLELNYMLYDNRTYFGSYKHTEHYGKLDYLILNNNFFIYKNYMFGEPLNISKSEKLDESELIDKVYSNRKIIIYKNRK